MMGGLGCRTLEGLGQEQEGERIGMQVSFRVHVSRTNVVRFLKLPQEGARAF